MTYLPCHEGSVSVSVWITRATTARFDRLFTVMVGCSGNSGVYQAMLATTIPNHNHNNNPKQNNKDIRNKIKKIRKLQHEFELNDSNACNTVLKLKTAQQQDKT